MALEKKEAFDKEVEILRKEYTNPSKFRNAVYKKIQDAPDEETKQLWRDFLMNKPGNTTTGNTTTGNTTTGNTTTGNTAPETPLTKESAWEIYNSPNGTANGLFESFNTFGMTAEEARKEFLSKVPTPSDAAKNAFKETYGVDLVVTGNTTTTTAPETPLTKESAWEIYNSKNGTANGLFQSFNTFGMTAEEARKEFLSKVPTPSDAAKKAFKEKYGVDLVVTGNTTTTTAPDTTLTKESAWEIYNSPNGTANGLFESFNILGMTAEEARKEFLSKVPTPSDAAKKAFKEKYGVDLVVTDKDKDKDKNKNKNKDKGKDKDKDKDDDEDDDEDKYKNKYKSSMYGIIDAMKNGDINPSTGIYFMLDALSKAARNTGIDIGNIGAQFSGGTVRNDYQDSLWSQRRNKMFENEMTSEINKQEGTDKEMEYKLAKEDLIGKGLSNEQADLALKASRTFNKKAEEFRKAGNDTLADLYALVGSAATKEVGPEELAAIAASNVLNTPEGKEAADEIIEALTGLVKTVGSTFGGINSILSFFDNLKNKWKK